MPELPMPAIEPSGVGAEEPFHARHQRGLGRLDDQMEVIGHQAVGMNLPFGLSGKGSVNGNDSAEKRFVTF
jgi:hypothetical protein